MVTTIFRPPTDDIATYAEYILTSRGTIIQDRAETMNIVKKQGPASALEEIATSCKWHKGTELWQLCFNH